MSLRALDSLSVAQEGAGGEAGGGLEEVRSRSFRHRRSQWTWKQIAEVGTEGEREREKAPPPCQRSLHTAAVHGDNIYIFGGYDGSNRLNDFYSFNIKTQSWSVMPSAGKVPTPRDRHVAFVFENSFFVFAGFDGTCRVNDFYEFSFDRMQWSVVTVLGGQTPSARHSHAAVIFGRSFFCFGGYDGSYRNDFHEFNFDTSTWKIVNAVGRPPRARYRASCVVSGSHMVLFGGHDGSRHLNDVHLFNFESKTWSPLEAGGLAPIPRDSHVAVVHGASMFVFGGSTGTAMNDLYELRLKENPPKWRQVQTHGTLPAQRFCHTGCVYQDSLFIFGGYDGSNRLNDFQELNFGEDPHEYEIPPSSIINDMKGFVNNELLSDITFIVEDTPIYAHKILCMRCPFFRALLTGEMMESRAREIVIPDVRAEIFLSLLEYLYTDELEVSLESAIELFEAADKFGVDRLKKICENKMLSSLSLDNAAAIFLAADRYSASALRGTALDFILENFDAVTKTQAFEEMGRTNVELVFEILKSR